MQEVVHLFEALAAFEVLHLFEALADGGDICELKLISICWRF